MGVLTGGCRFAPTSARHLCVEALLTRRKDRKMRPVDFFGNAVLVSVVAFILLMLGLGLLYHLF